MIDPVVYEPVGVGNRHDILKTHLSFAVVCHGALYTNPPTHAIKQLEVEGIKRKTVQCHDLRVVEPVYDCAADGGAGGGTEEEQGRGALQAGAHCCFLHGLELIFFPSCDLFFTGALGLH